MFGYDLSSTNNPWGWLVMFVTFLIDNHNENAFVSAMRESNLAHEYDYQDRLGWKEGYTSHPEWKERYMSDNQCVMIGNRWFYLFDGDAITIEGKRDQYGEMSVSLLMETVMRQCKSKTYAMKMIAGLGRGEESHRLADRLLKQVLVDLGQTEIVEAYEKLGKYYA